MMMRWGFGLVAVVLGVGQGVVQGQGMRDPVVVKMADSAMKEFPGGVVSTDNRPGAWGYTEGVLLDGMSAQWHATADGADFKYVKEAVDRYVTEDGTITGYGTDLHSLDEVEMGRVVVLLYRVTQEPKYYKAAKFIHDQLALQPRTPSGGYWHKKIYPNQMWLDSAYMAEPFRAEYAATFHEDGDWSDIAKQLLLMDVKMRDVKTGLLRHGWDESKQMPWADKSTGLSPEVWSRAMGWYAMALVDVLDWLPVDHPERRELISALNETMAAVLHYQDKETGLWWEVTDKGGKAGNFTEASASCMFVYALAKGVRMGYLPKSDEVNARRGWSGVVKTFVKTEPDGMETLTGTIKGAGLGGAPYRSGTYAYYIGERVISNDGKGIGAFLMAGSEMEQAATATLEQGKTVVVDAWFNSQTRKNAAGETELFHYKWDDDSNGGFAFFGRAFQRYGAILDEERAAPTAADLKRARIYIIASPDIPSKNPVPHFMEKKSGDEIEAWVKAGGTLMLMENDKPNAEFEHFNTLSERFGIHFNAVLRNHVVGNDFAAGTVMIPAGTGVFEHPHTAYMKDTCTITVSRPAKAVVTATTETKSDVMMAVAKVGKGTVYAVVDPWLYNEYVDHRNNLPAEFDPLNAAIDVAGWALRQ